MRLRHRGYRSREGRKSKRAGVALWCAVLIAVIAAVLHPAGKADGRTALKIGDLPPRVALPDMQGAQVTVPDDLRGRVVVVHFWASCSRCREEMPMIESIYGQYKGRGLSVIAISVGQSKDAAKAFLKDLKVSYPVLFDTDMKGARRYGVYAVPRTFILDRKGVIRYIIVGEATERTMKKLISGLL